MGFIELAREIATLPVRLTPQVVGLAVDATRYASSRVGEVFKAGAGRLSQPSETAASLDIAHHHRRSWSTAGRAHLELRAVEDTRQSEYLERVVSDLENLEGVVSATPLPGIGRVLVQFHDDMVSVDDVARTLDTLEADGGFDDAAFGLARPDHPGDREPINSALLLIGTDTASLGVAGLGKALRLPTAPVPLDVAGLLTVVSYVPWLRDVVDRKLQTPVAGIALSMARAVTGGLGQQLSGPAIDLVHRSSEIIAATSRHEAWQRLEPELVDSRPPDGAGSLLRDPRPGKLPQGPIERVVLPTSMAAFAGAGLGLLLHPDLDQTLSFLVAGSTKAARWGRQAHSAQLTTLLSSRDLLVMDVASLELLDRIDIIVISGDLITNGSGRGDLEPFAAEFLRQARTAGADVWVATDHAERFRRLPIAGTIGSGVEAASSVRGMQKSGHGVAVVAVGEDPALAVGDVTLGLRSADTPVPWNASIIGGDSLIDGFVLALAIESAKRNARQAARLAVAGTGVAGLTTLGGLRPGGLNRVMSAVNLSALVAHLNGMRLAAATARRALPQMPAANSYHALPVSAVMSELDSGPLGLSAEQAAARRPPQASSPRPVFEFIRATGKEMVNPLTPILAAGAGLAAAAGTVSDAAAVAGVMGLNALLGGTQRFRAERAARALLERASIPVTVIRTGQPTEVEVDDVVVGDIVHLQAGDVVPADCRIMSAAALEVDESSLTGESMPFSKGVDAVPVDTPVAERTSMLYGGTTIASGSVEGLVVATGADTEAFRGVNQDYSGPPETGVEQRLESLTARVSPVSVSAGLAVVGSGLARGLETSQVLGSGVGLAVAAVPEGLPLLATAAQQAAARRLSKRGVIVRNPRAIEALGRVNIVCVDKTGTLTVGKIRVETVADAHGSPSPTNSLNPAQRRVLAVARAATPHPEKGRRLAHPTDRAVVYAVDDAGLEWEAELGGWAATASLPFEPSRGYHAATGRIGEQHYLFVKGAPEVLLPACGHMRTPDGGISPMTPGDMEDVESALEESARRGLRLLVVAERQIPESTVPIDGLVADLTFIGSIGFADPIRPTSRKAVEDLATSEIRVLMITGDHPATAIGIAAELGLSTTDGVLTGSEIDEIDDEQLAGRLAETDICARVTPSHKARIVRTLRQSGHVVAMTGDGANDSLAIRLADVGIALGSRATDAARSVSDLVVIDDSIETIVSAVMEGRALWTSVRDAISILVGGNLGEIGFTLAGSLPSGVTPLNTRQLLLVNLMTDVLPAMAIAVSPPQGKSPRELMIEGPDKSLGRELDDAILTRAVVTALGAGGGWISARVTGRRKRAGTVALVSLVGTELGQTVVCSRRSPLVVASSALSLGVLAGVVQIPGLSQTFGCTPLGPLAWAQAMTSATTATVASLFAPSLTRRIRDRSSTSTVSTVPHHTVEAFANTGHSLERAAAEPFGA